MKAIKNIYIIGMGALGILFGDTFLQGDTGATVSFIVDEKRKARYSEGIYCNGKKCDFRMVDPATTGETADLLLFAVKSTTLASAIRDAVNFVGPDTIIISALNGITSEETIGAALGMEHMLYTVAQGMDAVKIGNELTYAHAGELRIGYPSAQPQKKDMLEAVTAFFDQTGQNYTVESDIIKRLYNKWMLNVGVNQVLMVTEGTYRTVQEPGEARDMMIAAMREVMQVANAEGIDLNEQDIRDYVALTDSLNPDGMTSMRQDGLARRYSEVEQFAGTVIEKAGKYGIAVPVNQKLYDTVKGIEKTYN